VIVLPMPLWASSLAISNPIMRSHSSIAPFGNRPRKSN
jgi:hypothetical protein